VLFPTPGGLALGVGFVTDLVVFEVCELDIPGPVRIPLLLFPVIVDRSGIES